MTTAVLKTASRTALALIMASMAGGAFAVTQSINPVSAQVTIDASYLTTNGFVLTGAGAASYANGVLTSPVVSASTSTNPGPLSINLGDTDGFRLAKGLTALNFGDFTFDAATNSLIGDVKLGNGLLFNYQDGAILVANNVQGSLGLDALTIVGNAAGARDLYLEASGFSIAPSLAAFVAEAGLDPALLSSVAGVVQKIQIGVPPVTPPVPEPSTYAMMGIGLVGVGILATRRKAKKA
jgi:hypothetical protein